MMMTQSKIHKKWTKETSIQYFVFFIYLINIGGYYGIEHKIVDALYIILWYCISGDPSGYFWIQKMQHPVYKANILFTNLSYNHNICHTLCNIWYFYPQWSLLLLLFFMIVLMICIRITGIHETNKIWNDQVTI